LYAFRYFQALLLLGIHASAVEIVFQTEDGGRFRRKSFRKCGWMSHSPHRPVALCEI
jgi:hypothetical protein